MSDNNSKKTDIDIMSDEEYERDRNDYNSCVTSYNGYPVTDLATLANRTIFTLDEVTRLRQRIRALEKMLLEASKELGEK